MASRATLEGTSQPLLAAIARWRQALVRSIAAENPELPATERPALAQAILERLLFLRLCEERGFLAAGQLGALASHSAVWKRLLDCFEAVDLCYGPDSTMGEGRADAACPLLERLRTLRLHDEVLSPLLREATDGARACAFSSQGSDLLGRVYEQYRATIVDREGIAKAVRSRWSAARKAAGVFYTPSCVVDFIVRQTVGRLLEEAPSQATAQSRHSGGDLEHRPLAVLDPACGGGAFLLGAYQFLLDWHLREYVRQGPDKAAGSLTRAASGAWRLTLRERARILLDHLYGVDIDPWAAAITRRALWLKLMEEPEGTSPKERAAIGEPAWRGLAANVRCGNALLGWESLPPAEQAPPQVEADGECRFQWGRAFPEVIRSGGFAAVIGNPPYVKEYSNRQAFESWKRGPLAKYYVGKMDLWYAFACAAIDLLRDGGRHSFIATNNWVTSAGARVLREKLRTECQLEQILDFGPAMAFGAAAVQTMIYVARKSSRRRRSVAYLRLNRRATADDIQRVLEGRTDAAAVESFAALLPESTNGGPFTFVDARQMRVLDKMTAAGTWRLRADEIAQGIVPNPDVVSRRALARLSSQTKRLMNARAGDPVFVVPRGYLGPLPEGEAQFLKPCYEPAELDRYRFPANHTRELIYLTRDNDPGDLVTLDRHLSRYREIMEARRENRLGRIGYRHLHWPRDERFFQAGPKVLCVRKCLRPVCVFTLEPAYVMLGFNVIRSDRIDLKLLTGLLNSRLIHFWLDQRGKKQGAQLQIDHQPLTELPLLPLDQLALRRSGRWACFATLVDEIMKVTAGRGSGSPRGVEAVAEQRHLERQLDAVIEELYALNTQDVAVMEQWAAAYSIH